MKKLIRLVFALLLFLLLAPLPADEDNVLSLEEIDELIENTEYNRALYEVAVYMETFPDDFDNAQLRVQRILSERLTYNIMSEELVDTLEEISNDENEEGLSDEELIERDEQTFTMISGIEEKERRQSKAQKEFTNQARRTISMGFYIRQYNRIMNLGKSLSDEGRLRESIMRYKSGLSSIVVESGHDKIFYFDDEGLPLELPIDYSEVMIGDKDIDSAVKEIIGVQEDPDRTVTSGRVYELMKDFDALYERCEIAYDNFVSACEANDGERAEREYEVLRSSLGSFVRIRNGLLECATELERISAIAVDAVKKKYDVEHNDADVSNLYMSYAANFLKGDPEVPETGVVSAMDMNLAKWIEALKVAVESQADNALAYAERTLPAESLFADETLFAPVMRTVGAIEKIAPMGDGFQSVYGEIDTVSGKKLDAELSTLSSSLDFASRFAAEVNVALQNAQILSAQKIFEGDDIDAQIETAMRFEEILDTASAQAPEFIGAEQVRENQYFARGQSVREKGSGTISYADKMLDFRSDIDYYGALRQRNISQAQERAGEVWAKIAGVFAKKGVETKSGYDKNYAQSLDIMNGTNETGLNENNMDTENEIVIKNARGAYQNALGLNETISAFENDVAAWNRALSRGQRFASTDQNLKDAISSLEATSRGLSELKAKNSALLSEAERRAREAARLIESGKSHYRLMERSANNFDYDESSNQYEQALKDYYEALDYQYSEELVRLITELNTLRSRVREIEVDEALAQVESLKRQANEHIFNGNYTPAVALLNQAKNLLAKKNIDPDTEIEELLLIIKDIQKSVKERTLSLQHPHYAELSRSLDEGHKDYDTGVDLKKRGDQSAAREKFEAAKLSVNNVLNEQPYNDEARDILFKTEYELNPGESFRTQFFEPKFREAEKEKDLDTLRDLEKFIPDYPGLKALIARIENEQNARAQVLKKRVDPTAKSAASDAAQTAEANRLAQEAQRIYASANGNEERMAEALRIANQALVIDSKNAVALRVSSAIRRARATVADAPLTVAQTRLLTAARNLRNSAPEKALEYMQQLMSNPSASRNTEVKKLYEQIQRRLGN
ncbi:MAG: hypothetical protein II921_02980 [Treponema sp.]|nr:hypothetical protein [Treponema sp.]